MKKMFIYSKYIIIVIVFFILLYINFAFSKKTLVYSGIITNKLYMPSKTYTKVDFMPVGKTMIPVTVCHTLPETYSINAGDHQFLLDKEQWDSIDVGSKIKVFKTNGRFIGSWGKTIQYNVDDRLK